MAFHGPRVELPDRRRQVCVDRYSEPSRQGVCRPSSFDGEIAVGLRTGQKGEHVRELIGVVRGQKPPAHEPCHSGTDIVDSAQLAALELTEECGPRPRIAGVSMDLSSSTIPELLRLWARIMSELRTRDVLRTNNNPVGDIAEAIVHEHFGGHRGSFSQKGWDVETADGVRIQVKGIRHTGGRGRRNLSAIRDQDYDVVVVVVFDTDFALTTGLTVPRAVVESLFPIRQHINGRIIVLTDALHNHPDVGTVDMTAAYDRVGNHRTLSPEAAVTAAVDGPC